MSYHVSTPVVVQAAVGTAGAMAAVGVAAEGMSLEFVTARREIKADGSGGAEGFPANYYYLSLAVTARVILVPFAGVYVNRLRSVAQASGLAGTPGTLPMPGELFGFAGGNLIDVMFASADPDGGFRLHDCLVAVAGDGTWSPDVTKLRFEFRATGYYDPSDFATVLGTTLYSRI